MDFIILLLKQNILMFLYLLIGYFLFRKKLIGISGSADIGRMLLHIVMPAAILKAYMTSYTPERLIGLVLSFLAALLALLLAIFISRIFFKKEQAIERFGAAFSNAGFIGIPLVQMTLGEEAVFYISSDRVRNPVPCIPDVRPCNDTGCTGPPEDLVCVYGPWIEVGAPGYMSTQNTLHRDRPYAKILIQPMCEDSPQEPGFYHL